jgi:hypothetical protein
MTQICIALCVYLLVAYLKFVSKSKRSMQQILNILQMNLFEKWSFHDPWIQQLSATQPTRNRR